MTIVFKSGNYVSVPMTENLFWNLINDQVKQNNGFRIGG